MRKATECTMGFFLKLCGDNEGYGARRYCIVHHTLKSPPIIVSHFALLTVAGLPAADSKPSLLEGCGTAPGRLQLAAWSVHRALRACQQPFYCSNSK
jgi:hypothetical protein